MAELRDTHASDQETASTTPATWLCNPHGESLADLALEDAEDRAASDAGAAPLDYDDGDLG